MKKSASLAVLVRRRRESGGSGVVQWDNSAAIVCDDLMARALARPTRPARPTPSSSSLLHCSYSSRAYVSLFARAYV